MGRGRRLLADVGFGVLFAVGCVALYGATDRYSNVGSMGEWVSGIGALVAIVVATATFRRQREFDLANREDDARQAEDASRRARLDRTRQLLNELILHLQTEVPPTPALVAEATHALTYYAKYMPPLGAGMLGVRVLNLWTEEQPTGTTNASAYRRILAELTGYIDRLSVELGDGVQRWGLTAMDMSQIEG